MAEDPKTCELCQRKGLPIYLTRVSVYDNLQDPNIFLPVPESLAPAPAKFQFKGARPILRSMRAGYVYVFVEKYKANKDKRWQIFRVHDNGLIQRIPDKDPIKSISACSRYADNFGPRFLVIEDANHIGKVQLAFSEHAWVHGVLDEYARNDALREKRMQRIDVSGWVSSGTAPQNGQAFDTGFLYQHVGFWRATDRQFSTPGQAQQHVHNDDYAYVKNSLLLNKTLASSQYASTEGFKEQLPELDAAQQNIQAKAGIKNKALLFVVNDPIGLATDLNKLRLYKLRQKVAWMGGATGLTQKADPERPHKHQSGSLIQQLVKAKSEQARHENEEYMRNESGALKTSSVGIGAPVMSVNPTYSEEDIKVGGDNAVKQKTERMQERYRWQQMDVYLKAYDAESKAWDDYIAKFDNDWKGWTDADKTHIDCVLTNDCKGKHARNMVALGIYSSDIFGGPVLSRASEQLYVKAFAARQIADTNWIMRCLGLNDESLLGELAKQLSSETEQADAGARVYDVLKRTLENVTEAPKAWKELQESMEEFAHSVKHGAAHSGGETTAGTATAEHATAVSGAAGTALALDELGPKLVLFDQGAETLIYTGAETMSRIAAAAKAGKPIGGINPSLIDVDFFQQRLFRFGAVNYAISKGELLYTATVQLKLPEFLNAANAASPLVRADAAVLHELDQIAKTSKDGVQAMQKAEGIARLVVPANAKEITSTIIIKRPLGQATNTAAASIKVHAGGPMGTSAQTSVIITEDALVTQMSLPNAKPAAAAPEAVTVPKAPSAFGFGLSGALFVFQAWVFFKSIGDMQGEEDKTLPVLSATSAVLGMSSAGAEAAALWRKRAAAAVGEGEEVAAKALRLSANRLAFGAGLAAAGACFVDAAGMLLKASRKRGINDAAATGYLLSGISFLSSSGFSSAGSYLAYVSGGGQLGQRVVMGAATRYVAKRALMQAGVEITGEAIAGAVVTEEAAVAAAAAVGVVASWATGIGLVLTVIGIAWSLWAAMMEDDAAEAFLRQTAWGIKDDKEPFENVDDEMQAYYQLQYGMQVKLGFDRPWYGMGTIKGMTVQIGAGYFQPGVSILDYQVLVDGKTVATGHYTGKALPSGMEGGAKRVQGVADAWMLDLDGEAPMPDGDVSKATLTYTYRPLGLGGVLLTGSVAHPIYKPDLSHATMGL